MQFEFDEKEVRLIDQILQERLGELREQIYHSETPSFHDELKGTEAALRGILDKLGVFFGESTFVRTA